MVATKGYGFTLEMIDWSSPADMEPYVKAHEEELREKDYLAWAQGQYFASALDSTVCNAILWRKKGEKSHGYIEKPMFQRTMENPNENTYEESQEEIAVFEMKQRISLLRKYGLPESPA